MGRKAVLKRLLGEMPFTAEVYWQLRQRGKPLNKSFSLQKLEKHLPEWRSQAILAAERFQMDSSRPRRVMVFAVKRFWIEHATLFSMTLAGLGHQVSLAYLPYPNWHRALNPFDIRRHNAYAQSIFQEANPPLETLSLLDIKPTPVHAMPASLVKAIEEVALRDTQYTLQIEEVDRQNEQTDSGRLYQLRLERNFDAAGAALAWIDALEPDQRPEVLITPNGSILEMGAVYQVARHLDIPAVTYEFGEQRERIWLALNSEVMLQESRALWETFKDHPLTEKQWEQVHTLYNSRQDASLWNNFSRLWQEVPSQGGEQVRQALSLDSRPIVLLAANVIGDSLTLGRQVFSQNMTEWLEHSVQFFAERPDVQLIVRIHPGERYLDGPSVAEVVQNALSEIPAHIHLVLAPAPINTYDLVEIADLGLAYTTTVGMEMAMSGIPVIVGGQTHYRGKGFTLDPVSWEHYHQLLEQCLSAPEKYRLNREEVESAWNYAYRFYFDYPCPFPWHLLDFWEKLEIWPVERVLSEEGQAFFGDTFRYMVGENRTWSPASIAIT